jgi:Leucine-rich repeat (LRR) protein
MLNLSKNNIANIEGLRELTRLRVLDLSYNRILRIGHGRFLFEHLWFIIFVLDNSFH